MDSARFPSSWLVHAIIFQAIILFPTIAIGGNKTDQLSLLEFKTRIIEDPFGVLSSWNDTIYFCYWYGVSCGRRHQRVTALDLHYLKLGGSITPHIGNLSFLRRLWLQNNNFRGEIPPEIGRLRRLQQIVLSNNSFTGEIPSNLSACSNLMYLCLGNNKLVGNIPSEFRALQKIQVFEIRTNNLIGSIPPFLGNFSSLEILTACFNGFSGSIPEALGGLTKLQEISLCDNYLSGTIPPSLYNISSITIFIVEKNQIQGTLPTELGISLPNLEIFGIARNLFTGSIPVSLSNATNLRIFIIVHNQLTGKIPSLDKLHGLRDFGISYNQIGTGDEDLSFISSLVNATHFQLLDIQYNNFQGFLPQSIGNFSIATTEELVFSGNQISGPIPANIQNLVNLQVLYLDHNKFTGTVPNGIGMLKKLHYLNFEANEFSGNIPSSIGNLSLLIHLAFSENHFQGHIPPSIGKCQKLQLLDLSDNNLNGSIPKEVFGLSSLSIYLDLSNNSLAGFLTNEVGNLGNLGGLYVSNNMLSGEIPSGLGSCVRLETLMMHENLFQGAIPSALSELRGLQILYLSNNNLSGQIPAFLEDFISLKFLDLSFNNFEGEVPLEGVFRNVTATSLTGNNMLCGGIPEFHLPTCVLNNSQGSKFSHTVKLVVIIISRCLGVTFLLLMLYVLLHPRKTRTTPALSILGIVQVSYQSLLKATDGFSSSNLIGIGSFGSVYQGLEENGTKIAVKVLNLLHRGASQSFLAECEALRNIRHRNLVKIITVCSCLDYGGNDFKALVYGFMENGSLEDWLHPSPTANEAHDQAPKTINFLQRLNVATDVACALDYLHHQCETTLVHCDVKPSNVLLDQVMTAHLGDFGLARFLQEPSRANQTYSIGARGTVGYVAPEYGMGSEISTCGDVYSYGILLLEMFTGKRPIDDMFKEGLDLHKFTSIALPERVVDILDPLLLHEVASMENRQGEKVHKALISILEIGVACSAENPPERMSMNDAAAKLVSIRRKII